MMFFLSLFMLVMGLEEFRKGRKVMGWISIVAFLFILFVSLQTSPTKPANSLSIFFNKKFKLTMLY